MNNNEILSILFSIIPMEQVESVTWYGNRRGKDVDLFVVLRSGLSYCSLAYRSLDISCIGKIWLPTMINNLDPTVTEPLLTGTVIFGSIEKYRNSLSHTKVTDDVPLYLLQCAEIYYEWATIHAMENRIREASATLCFVYSNLLYALKYWGGNDVVLFKDVLSGKDGVWIRQARRKYKNQAFFIDSDVRKAFDDTRRMLTDARLIVGL